ncbi:phosphate ABC transporter substrate-binding protein PstS family protein [Agrilactobacillus fermenti]|uniref:phosphate ABC transporter substrate-binding protein PstS family protein n=1 Tax=Agrilactobacillus fermenti TaxID=2586909 RepID=UPI001E3B6C09|nr:phosphate ABC transporter substrate-binding protein PstS family protein [Agrilactobacillus fermenti]MCD2257011.1 phosphate ABC transporter substrate-binding protein PstS family protein [Agrilactobacillus fermenti]
MNKRLLLPIITLIGVVTLTGCGSKSASGQSQAKSADKNEITAVGSTALQPLAEQTGREFADNHSGLQINVQGGGSGTGLSQVAQGNATIGNSDIFAEEKDGVNAKQLVDHKVAVVGIAPVANKEAGVTNLTHQQLIDIFTKKVTNWKDVGGKDQTIILINRAQGSGTRATFEALALNKQKAATAPEQDSSGTVQKMIANTPGAISYLAFSYFNDKIQPVSVDNVKPTAENVAINKWKIWSYEHMYTKGSPNANTAKFINYVQSKKVQNSLVKKLGYIPMQQMHVERNAQGTIEDVKP